MREPVLVRSKPGAFNPWPAQYFLEPSVTMILISVQKIANRSLISIEDPFFFLEITIILMQKVGCFLCMA